MPEMLLVPLDHDAVLHEATSSRLVTNDADLPYSHDAVITRETR